MDPIYVTGHRNPDTDSIVSAIAYAALRNSLGDREFVAARLGHISDETHRILERFDFQPPVLISTMRTQVRDLDYDMPPALAAGVTIARAWEALQANHNIPGIPVTDEEGHLFGMVSPAEIADFDMEVTSGAQAECIPVFNLLSVLEGQILNENGNLVDVVSGEVCIALPRPGKTCSSTARIPSSSAAISRRWCGVPWRKTSAASSSARRSSPRSFAMVPRRRASSPRPLTPCALPGSSTTPFPWIVFAAGKGWSASIWTISSTTSRRWFPRAATGTTPFSMKTKKSWAPSHGSICCVPGASGWCWWITTRLPSRCGGSTRPRSWRSSTTTAWPNSNIQPIYFRNDVVGSTATIISGMYQERGLMPSSKLAGLLAAAIVSDTVMFKSPTCTERDHRMAERMARIAGLNLDELGQFIFAENSNLEKPAEELVLTDFKDFHIAEHYLGVSQITCVDSEKLMSRQEEFLEVMRKLMEERSYSMMILMLTDVLAEGSHLLYLGDEEIFRQAFNTELKSHACFLPGIVSRKKQVIPMLTALWG